MILKKICTVCNEITFLLPFQNLQEVNEIFKMVASIGLIQVRNLIFGLLLLSYFIRI